MSKKARTQIATATKQFQELLDGHEQSAEEPSSNELQKNESKQASPWNHLRHGLASMPGLRGVPGRLLDRLLPPEDTSAVIFDKKDTILNLYAGKDDHRLPMPLGTSGGKSYLSVGQTRPLRICR